MRANTWLYQYYSLHSKMHYGLAYEAHPSRLPTYYSAMMPYHPSPSDAAVPHSPYHLHPPPPPLNGSSVQSQPSAPPSILQYGGVPYTSLPSETEQARWPSAVKRPASPTSSSPSKSPPRLPSNTSSSISRTSSGGYQAATAEVVVPPSAYYGSTQMFAAVSYSHLVSLRSQKQVDEESVEQSLTPTNTEEVSAMISLANRPTSYIPIASVLSESNRVLSDGCTEDLVRRQDDVSSRSHLFCSSPRSATNRFDLSYMRYGNPYPLVDLDHRRRFSKWDKDIREGFWTGSDTHSHLMPIQGECFPYGDGSCTKSPYLETGPMYQDIGQEQSFRARFLGYDLPRRDEVLRLSSENHHSTGLESHTEVYGSNNLAGSRPCLVRPSNSPSPHSRASSSS